VKQRTAAGIVVVLLGLLLAVLVVRPPVWLLDPGPYESTNVTVHDDNGTELETVEVRIADNRAKRVVGLSETDSLANDSGMLFIHSNEDTQSYVMRDMSFPLDIIFIDGDGEITTIYHAPQNSDATYEARGKYVLEVNRGWTNATGVDVGDTVAIPDGID
jgi:uncharacterized membrane protein (UPF0127 family)